jgi:choice-of-anchor B domain-containing protein
MAHNIYIGEIDYTTGVTVTGSTAYAYILGSNKSNGAYHILDLTNPITPVEVTPPQSIDYAHDATTLVITDSRTAACAPSHSPCDLLVDYNATSIDLWDVTDKSTPFKISSTTYEAAVYIHSGWWSADKQYLFIQDESDERDGFGPNFPPVYTTLHTLDISDLANPFISNAWTGPTTARDHNGFTKGDRYYMSNYQRGLTILDIADPNDPQQVAFFDTYPPGDNSPYAGAWGVYPYLPSGTIIVSDMQGGLFLLREGPSRSGTRLYMPIIVK